MGAQWLNQYESDIPQDITVPQCSVFDLMEERFKKFSSKPAFRCMGSQFTYQELNTYSKKFASYLQNDLGLGKGDKLAIMMPNCLQYPIAMYGALRAGIVVVNVNPLYTERELLHQLNDSSCSAIIILKNFAHTLEKIISQTKVKKVITTGLGDLLPFPKNHLVNSVLKYVKKMVPDYQFENEISFGQAISKGTENTFVRPKIDPEDIAFLQYTGGTTGLSKGAILTNRNIVANIIQASTWIKSRIVEGEEIIITALPLYHIFSLTANCLTYGYYGGLNILIPNPRDLNGFIKAIKSVPFSAFTGVNTLFNGLINHKDFSNLNFSNLRITLGGGMAVTENVANKWQELTGCTLSQAYGLTETSPAVCINPVISKSFNGSIGLPISSTEVSVRDNEGRTLSSDKEGELWIKGPQVMKGYWQKPEETEKVLTPDGWFKSGDIAKIDDEGYVYIVDRIKDMILVSGFNVYPNEIDDVVSNHEGILEAAAKGVPDDKSGEAVKLFVVRKDPSLTEAAVKKFCKDNLTPYKCPKSVVFCDELPKTNVGKILRRALK